MSSTTKPEGEDKGPRRPEALTGDEAQRLVGLLDAVEGAEDLLVVTHDNPDPDALASAAALSFLVERTSGLRATLAFGGIVGRAENKALIDEIGADFKPIGRNDEIGAQTAVALVDTQPRAGNNSLPAGRIANVVIDHHPLRSETAASSFADVRPEYGASCSMLVEYLRAAGLEPDRQLATALFYGVQSETADLGREVSPADISASLYLYPRTDPTAYARIRHPRLPASYFRSIHQALERAQRYGNVLIASAGRLTHPDMVAELADLLLRARGVEWSIAMGTYGSNLLISVRGSDPVAHAGELVRHVVGDRGSAGGHGMLAGGQIDVRGLSEEEADSLTRSIALDLLEALGVAGEEPIPLIGK